MKTMILITLLLPMVLLNGCKDKTQDKVSNIPDSTFAATLPLPITITSSENTSIKQIKQP